MNHASPDQPVGAPSPTTPAGRTPRSRLGAARLEGVLTVVVALVVAGLYVLDASAHGALGVARNDDWVYYRTAFAFAETGRLSFDPYTSTLLVGQVLGAQPVLFLFGTHIAALQLGVAVLSAVTLGASYLLVRRFLDVRWSLLCVAVLAVGPIWGGLSVSFMSDVPAAALQVLALCAAVPALSRARVRWGWLTVSFVLCLLAFSVREYSLAAVLAVGATAVLTHGRSRQSRRVVLGVGAMLLAWGAVALALFTWRASLVSGPRALAVNLELDQRVAYVAVGLLTTTGFLLFPVALAVWRGGRWRTYRRWWPMLLGMVVAFTLTSTVLHFPLILGNYITAVGSYSGSIAGRPPTLFSTQVWWGLQAAAAVSTALLLTFATARTTGVVRQHRQTRGAAVDTPGVGTRAGVRAGVDPAPRLALAFGASTLVLTTVACLVTHARPFDRYVVVALPFLAAAAVHASRSARPQRAGRVVTSAGLAVLALVGVVQVDASATVDGAKWALGQGSTRLGYAPATVDAGYEWFGLHQHEPVIYDAHHVKGFSSWVTTLFADARVCVNGEYAPRPIRAEAYAGELVRVSRTTLFGLDYTLIGRSVDRGCDSPVTARGQDGGS